MRYYIDRQPGLGGPGPWFQFLIWNNKSVTFGTRAYVHTCKDSKATDFWKRKGNNMDEFKRIVEENG